MGEPSNIVVQENGARIYFYSHWGGSDIEKVAARGLARGRSRWRDEPYLNRILFSTMIEDDVQGETGFGISTYETDRGAEVLIDHDTLTVSFRGDTFTFEEFVARYHRETTE